MQFTSYYSTPAEQALLTLQVREAELRVAREELAFLLACGGAGKEDVRRLRSGLGLLGAAEEEGGGADDDVVVVVKEEKVDEGGVICDDGCVGSSSSADPGSSNDLVSLKTILAPLVDASVARLCRRMRPALEQKGVRVFKRQRLAHVRGCDSAKALELGRLVWGGFMG